MYGLGLGEEGLGLSFLSCHSLAGERRANWAVDVNNASLQFVNPPAQLNYH